jgi:hypothetical protein
MGKSAPTAPDPTTTANAQTASNEQTAAYNQQLNMINSTGPNGSVSYTPSNAPGGYTQNTQLSPAEQQIYDQSTQAQNSALGVANQQIGRVADALGNTVTPGSAGAIQTSFDPGAPVQTSYNNGGAIQSQVTGSGANPNAVQNAQNAAYNTATQYLTPQYQQSNEQLQSQLVAQGLNPNDAAYQNAVTLQNNAQNQGYQGAINAATTAGDTEQNTLYSQNLASGQFANSAQLQGNTENAAAAQFNNTAAGQQYSQNEGEAQFGNTAQQQNYNEQMQSQEQPINEFNSLLSSGQVAAPTGVNYTPSQAQSTNVAGITQNSFQDQLAADNVSNNAINSGLGGLFSLGSAALTKYSDARLKDDVRRVGTLDSGLPIYAYRYKGSSRFEIGVLAQEARVTHPHAVRHDGAGFLKVDYGALS